MSEINWNVVFYTSHTIYNSFLDILNFLNIQTRRELHKLDYLAIQCNKRKEYEIFLFDIETLKNTPIIEYLPKNKYIILFNTKISNESEVSNIPLYNVIKNAYMLWYYDDTDNTNHTIINSLFHCTSACKIINAPSFRRCNKMTDILFQCEMTERNNNIIMCLGQYFNVKWCKHDRISHYISDSKIVLYLLGQNHSEKSLQDNDNMLYQMAHVLHSNNCCVIKEDNGVLFKDYFNYLKQNTYFQLCNVIEDKNSKSMEHLVLHINSLLSKFSNITNLLNLEAFEKTFQMTHKYNSINMYNFASQYQYSDSVQLLEDFDDKKNNARYFPYYEKYIQYTKLNNKMNNTLSVNNRNNCVFCVFDRHPHSEMILHNTIKMFHNQGYNWNHIIICGSHNVNYVRIIYKKIKQYFDDINIEIKQLDIFSGERETINNIFYLTEFWNLIPGELIFLYNSRFDDWNLNINDVIDFNFVTDKAILEPKYSMRRKSHMIDILHKYPISSIQFDYSVILDFMGQYKFTLPPETVYFSGVYLQKQYGNIRFKN